MSERIERDKVTEDLRKLVSQDQALAEVIESIKKASPPKGEGQKILMPYVSAPILAECAWN